jgi:hypothetical protein
LKLNQEQARELVTKLTQMTAVRFVGSKPVEVTGLPGGVSGDHETLTALLTNIVAQVQASQPSEEAATAGDVIAAFLAPVVAGQANPVADTFILQLNAAVQASDSVAAPAAL